MNGIGAGKNGLRTKNGNLIDAHEWSKAIMNDNHVDIFYEFSNNKLWIKIVNKATTNINNNTILSDFAIAFNKNWAGLSIASAPRFQEKLEYGDSLEIPIDLSASETLTTHFEQNLMQAALRTNLGVKMFAIEIDPFEILLPIKMTDAELKAAWDSTKDDIKIEIDGKMRSPDDLASKGVQVFQNNVDGLNVAITISYKYL